MRETMISAQDSGESWQLYNGDCVEVMAGLPDNSVSYQLSSPPFISLYTFSDDIRDVSNCRDDKDFWTSMRFIIRELFRVVKPGRLSSMHCMLLPTSIQRDGFIGLRDFRGDLIRAHQEAGWIFHSEVVIAKSAVSAMMRTKAIGLLHKQLVKDSSFSRMAIPDYILTFRKPGENVEPIDGLLETYYDDDLTDEAFTRCAAQSWQASGNRTLEQHKSIQVWQRYAEPVWMDINQSDVLSHRVAREEHDERHISPLQLTPVRRCMDLWSNPGDIVLSPFTGIGTVGYVAMELGRRFLGAELKASYYRQAVANIRLAEQQRLSGTLFDAADRSEQPAVDQFLVGAIWDE